MQIYEPSNRISAVVSQTSFREETIEVASQSELFCRANNSRVKVHYDVAFAMLPT